MSIRSHRALCEGRVRLFSFLLLAIVFLFALLLTADPERRFGFLRDATRREDVRKILTFLEESRRLENGAVPNGVDATFETFQMLGTSKTACANMCGAIPTEEACLSLSSFPIPVEPNIGTLEKTGYAINRTSSGRFEVVACHPERAREIRLRR